MDADTIFYNVTPLTTAATGRTASAALVAHLWEWFRALADAEPIRNQTDTGYRRALALALADKQDGRCALCLTPFRVSALTGRPVVALENVTGTLSQDGALDCDRLPYLHGGVVALHGDCNSNHDQRVAWMRAHGVTHRRLTDTATALASVRP